MVRIMILLKGAVVRKKDSRFLIRLQTGRQVWAAPTFKLSIGDEVLVSWNHTDDSVVAITTQGRLNEDEGEAEAFSDPLGQIAEVESENEVEAFSRPRGETAEDEVEDEESDDDDFDSATNETGGADIESVHRHNINSLYL